MRPAVCLVAVLAACGIQNKVAPDGAASDGLVTGDGNGSGSGGPLTIALTDKPAVLGNQATVSFGFTTSIPATTECREGSAAYAACTSPDAVGPLTDGMHAFDVRATADSQTAAVPTYSFAVDTVAPALAITGQPAMTSPVSTAQFHFTIDDATTVTCALDSAAPAACTSPIGYTGLVDGSHTFTLTGSDGAGNTTTKTYSWTVDTSAPALAITVEPANPSTSSAAQFQFTTGSSVTVICQLDSAAAVACTSPKTYAGLAEGSHTFTLKGTNAAGLTTTVTYTWTVDTVAPSVAITSSPPANSNSPAAQFAFTVGDSATVTCQLDGGTPASCTSPWTYNSLADGAHTFTLKGTDTAGNTTTRTHSWNVDTVAPVVTLTGTPGNPSTSASAAFMFTVTGATSVTCQLDGGAATACTSPAGYSGVADGSHTFTVTARDTAGNAATQSFTWMVDTTRPVVTFTATPPNPSNVAGPQFSFTVSETSTVTCQVDGGTPVPCSGSFTTPALTDGAHTFVVRAADAAGNAGLATYSWTIDTVKPVITIYNPPPANTRTPSWSYVLSETSSVTYMLDLSSYGTATSPLTLTGIADGPHTLYLEATDPAGNKGSATYSWTLDATLPSVSVSYSCDTTGVTYNWSSSDASGISSCSCTVNGPGGGTSSCASSGSAFYNNFQNTSFSVTCTDAYGNARTASKTLTTTNINACQL